MSNGFLVIDKEGGMTSHDVVAKMRKLLGTKRVGHAGTLDPMATGVLVLGTGNATKLLQYIVDGAKRYEATILLGTTTVSDDREGEVIATKDSLHITDEEIHSGLAKYVGKIQQRPSSVSAIKVDGKRAHERVRDGEVVELPAREVEITSINVLEIRRSTFVEIDIVVECGAGTYIRAIARDLGEALEVGGHLTSLRRTLVSPFDISVATKLGDFTPDQVIPTLAGISKILPTRSLTFDEMAEISFGRALDPNPGPGLFAAASPDGRFAALLENREISGKSSAHPTLVAVKE